MGDLALGLVGSMVGGLVFGLLGIQPGGLLAICGQIIIAAIGAVLFVWMCRCVCGWIGWLSGDGPFVVHL